MKTIKNKTIVVDSCVLIYAGEERYHNKFSDLLKTFSDNGNKLIISTFSGFEVLKNIQEEKTTEYYLELLDSFNNSSVSNDILIYAAQLSRLYNQGKQLSPHSAENNKKDIAGDLIIGSTAIFHRALLLTANKKDFSPDFWKVVSRDYAVYDYKDQYYLQNVYLLQFNTKKYSPSTWLSPYKNPVK